MLSSTHQKVSILIKKTLIIFCCVITSSIVHSQKIPPENEQTYELNKNRLKKVAIGGGLLYTGTMIGLNQLWYADYEKTSFHFFNDNTEWMQMDKIGHSVTAYHFAKAAKSSLEWAGLSSNKARNYGVAYGLIFQSTIELLDGYSAQWGASTGDMIANAAGGAILWGQDVAWQEQRVNMKYSYSKSDYTDLRPGTFGENWQERFLKDYNGQTYWLSANIKSFLSDDSKVPSWLNIAAGYGIDGITGANENPEEFGFFDRDRQYYLSLDVDLERINSKSKVVNFLFSTFSFIKIPAPTIEFSGTNTKIHWLHF
ncbi:MAG: hypothetical protein ACI8XB_001098 [Patiriisocius sp.]|jgi:hypothetical protein